MFRVGLFLLFLPSTILAQNPLGSEITYQGELTFNDSPANGEFDFNFRLFDAESGGLQIGPPVSVENLMVTEGLFNVAIDFGASAFVGQKVWLGIGVREGTSTGSYTELLPLQQITSAPYAVHSQFVGTDAVTSAEILDGSIMTVDLQDNSVTAGKIAAGSVGNTELAAESVGLAEIISTEVQRRVSSNCPDFNYLSGINEDGSPICNRLPFGFDVLLDATGSVGLWSDITFGTDNNPVISYFDGSNGDLKVIKCSNSACSSANTITTVDAAGAVGLFTSIAVGADNNPVISFFDNSNNDLKVAKCNDDACSNSGTTIITTVDSGGYVGWSNSIAIGDDNNPVISYHDSNNSNLKVAKCSDSTCSNTGANIITTIDSMGLFGIYTSIAIGDDSNPVISYNDGDSLIVIKCSNSACSNTGANIISTLDTGAVGYYPSIAIGSDGNPVISYFDDINEDLKVLKCSNSACDDVGSNAITTVDSAGAVGETTSIAIGSDDNPIISYYDFTNGDLKVIKCSNAACSSTNIITTVDSVGDVGVQSSIAIGADGIPIISYRDETNSDLKVYSCGDISCQR